VPRLLVHVEGETEETFVNELLRPHLFGFGFTGVSARLVGNSRVRDRRGGIKPWNAIRSDILRHLKEDSESVSTTMVDYYGLPQQPGKEWPGRAAAGKMPFSKKALHIETAIHEDICARMGSGFNPERFIPFVVMHEFEGLLFSDCEGFGNGIGRPDLIPAFQAIRDKFPSPEEINDDPRTAPSKRVAKLCAGYQKPLLGPFAVSEIGLKKIRSECRHFGEWLARLEKLR